MCCLPSCILSKVKCVEDKTPSYIRIQYSLNLTVYKLDCLHERMVETETGVRRMQSNIDLLNINAFGIKDLMTANTKM
jgi:hypothetical protein